MAGCDAEEEGASSVSELEIARPGRRHSAVQRRPGRHDHRVEAEKSGTTVICSVFCLHLFSLHSACEVIDVALTRADNLQLSVPIRKNRHIRRHIAVPIIRSRNGIPSRLDLAMDPDFEACMRLRQIRLRQGRIHPSRTEPSRVSPINQQQEYIRILDGSADS